MNNLENNLKENETNEEKKNTFKEKKNSYSFNLDNSRLFWFIAIIVLFAVFVFLLGYWFGNELGNSESDADTLTLNSSGLYENRNDLKDTDISNSDNEISEKKIKNSNRISENDILTLFNDNNQKLNNKNSVNKIETNNIEESNKIENKINKEQFTKDIDDIKNGKTNVIENKNDINVNKIKTENKIDKNRKSIVSEENLYTDRGIDKNYSYIKGPCTIQVATHTNEKMANKINDILLLKKFNSYIDEYTAVNGKKLYKIKIGKYENVQSAKSVLRELIKHKDIKDIEKSIIVGAK